MAKRHKTEDAESEEEYEFVPAEFDEDAFIHKEMVSFHTTVTLFVAGIVAAIASWGAFAVLGGANTGWLAGLAIVAITFGALRTILRLSKIDISHWARREWMGTAFLLFFAWLAFFIMFINPPISDFADPDVIVYTSPAAVATGDDLVIDLFYTDNGKIVSRGFDLTGPNTAGFADLDKITGTHYQYNLEGAATGTYTWTASATDAKGRQTDVNGTVLVGGNLLNVQLDDLTQAKGTIVVKVPEALNLWALYAEVSGGGRVYFELDEKFGGWIATANFAGWTEGNNTFTVKAEEKNRFQGETPVLGGILAAGPFEVEVADVGDYKGGQPKRANPTDAPIRSVPGIELPLLAAGLLGLAFVRRK